MRKYRLLVMAACLLCLSTQTIAQLGPDTKAPVSPEAATIKQYSSFPMNYSSGMANITIPLYEIKVGDITLPITLSYTSNGLKPNEPVGCVGTGWSLDVEPGVSCSAKGIPDNTAPSGDALGGYFYSSLDGDWASKDYLKKIISGGDTEADLFSYRLADQSGSFYVSADNGKGPLDTLKLITSSASNSRVQIYAEKGLSAMTIYDGKGLIYNLGGSPGTGPKYEHIGGTHYPRLVCSQITSSKTGAKVTFKHNGYRYYDFGGKNSLDDYVILEDNFYHSSELPILTKKINGVTKSYRVNHDSYTGKTKFVEMDAVHYEHMRAAMSSNYINSPCLDTITFDNGYVKFVYGPDSLFKSLSSILIKDANNVVVKEIKFNISRYRSFEKNTHPTLGFRTKLESVEIKGPGITKPMIYRFSYQDEDAIPPFNTRSIDHWGYYHFRNPYYMSMDTASIVPKATIVCKPYAENSTTVPINIGNAIGRGAPDAWYPGIGMLKSIVSPEGTETSFEYESNRVYAVTILDDNNYYDNDVMYVGGLRVRRIKEKDLISGKSVYRTFTYDTYNHKTKTLGGKRAGIKSYPDLTIYDYTTAHNKVTYADVESRVRMWSASAVYPISFGNGSTALYNYVEEVTTNDQDEQTGKTVYYFTSIENYVDINNKRTETNMYFPTNLGTKWNDFERQEFTNGYPLRTEYYKVENGQEKLVSKKEYEYAQKTDAGSIVDRKAYNSGVYYPRYSDTESSPYRSKEVYKYIKRDTVLYYNRLTEEKETLYPSDNDTSKIQNIKRYRYPDQLNLGTYPMHRNPSEITQVLEDGQTAVSSTIYSGDNSSVVSSMDTGTKTLNSNKNYNALIEQKTVKGSAETISRIQYTDSRVTKVLGKTNQMADFDTKGEYLYNTYGNVRQAYENGVYTTFLWGYNNQQMYAKIQNASYSEVTAKIPAATITSNEIAKSINESLINQVKGLNSSSKIKAYTYEYKPLVGVVRMIDPNGIEARFEYDGLGRLSKVLHSEPGGTPVTISEYQYNSTSVVQ